MPCVFYNTETTGTDPALSSHCEMIRQIRAKSPEWSPDTFIGFNSLEFDENLL